MSTDKKWLKAQNNLDSFNVIFTQKQNVQFEVFLKSYLEFLAWEYWRVVEVDMERISHLVYNIGLVHCINKQET